MSRLSQSRLSDDGGTIDETEVLTHVGSASLEIVIEASDLQAGEQAGAYTVLCDLLETRLGEVCSQVVGCLLFAGEPDPASLVTGLIGMQRNSGVFTPVLPLSRSQAESLAAARTDLGRLIDDAAALIGIAADRYPIMTENAETLLDEIDELIDRKT